MKAKITIKPKKEKPRRGANNKKTQKRSAAALLF
jgi:hypothetical protein